MLSAIASSSGGLDLVPAVEVTCQRGDIFVINFFCKFSFAKQTFFGSNIAFFADVSHKIS